MALTEASKMLLDDPLLLDDLIKAGKRDGAARFLAVLEGEARGEDTAYILTHWSENADGYVVAPLVNRGTLDAD